VEEKFLDVRGARVHLLEGGQGEPLVYLHGAGSAGAWSPFLEALAQRYHVIAPTHPGFGKSERPEWIDRVDDVAFFYLDVLDQLGVDRMHLMGHSVGGWIAACLTTIANHRVRRLVLSDAAGLKPDGVHLPDLFALSEAQSAEIMVYDPAEREARANAKPSVELLERQLSDRAALARLAWNPYLHDPKLPHRLHRASMPCLLVWGKQDGLFPVALAGAWLEHLPNARLEVIDQAGHNPGREQAEQVARVVLEFLAEEAR
jgi:pimeloyl-ACP methyl ester carboxylesterase